MPIAELFSFQGVERDPALIALPSRPGLRAKCMHCGEQILNERQVLVDGLTLGATRAGQGYYRGTG